MNKRSEERDREYGGFTDSMIKAAKIAELMMNKEFTTTDMFKAMMALKLSRLAYSPKFDSMVDLIGYTEGWHNYINDPRFKVVTEEDVWNEIDKPKPEEVIDQLKHLLEKDEKTQQYKNLDSITEWQKTLEWINTYYDAIQLLEGKGYRVFGPEKKPQDSGGHSFTESMDWKDQQK